LPHCQIKTAARTDSTGKYGLPFSVSFGKIFWQRLNGKRHFRQGIMAKGQLQALPITLKKWQVYMAKRESLYDKAQSYAL
jgi:hypothetical protein